MDVMLLKIAVLLVITKIGGLICRKIKMPEVLGSLMAGVILGPLVFNVIHHDEAIEILANLGVILLMFFAGIETDVEQFKKAGKSSFVIAVFGVLVPLVLGTAGAYLFFNNIIQNIFIGVILTATSVSITVATLNELRRLRSRAGINILGAAVIDDIVGLLMISVLIAYVNKNDGTSLVTTVVEVIAFCGLSGLAVVYLPKLVSKFLNSMQPTRAVFTFSIAGAIIMAVLAEEVGIASITGAYVFGLIISQIERKEYFKHRVKILSSGFLSPIFFASVGLTATREGLSLELLIVTLVMFVMAVLGKVSGCSLGAKLFKFKNSESIQIGVGMISRGEVAIITANLGLQADIISQAVFVPTILVVLLTTIITPILLKIVFAPRFEQLVDGKRY